MSPGRSGVGKTKRRGGSGYQTSYGNAQQIARLNKRIGGFAGLELLFYDTNVSYRYLANNAVSAGGEVDPTTLDCLNSMIQGIGASTRLGRHIHMKSIRIKFQFDLAVLGPQLTAPGDVTIYVALVLDKQTNKATLKSEDVYSNPSGIYALQSSPEINLENTDRFRILKSKQFKMARSTAALVSYIPSTDVRTYSSARVTKDFTWNCNLRNMKVLFFGAGGGIGAIADKSLHVVAFCDVSGAPAAPHISYQSRLRYTTS